MELREQLQRTLGGAYVLDRELTGGGMSHVFVAQDTALGRTVVVKVLPPESTAGVNIDRFKREIQVAARLQHAHIVPVLTAGETNGLPFYTMPFVEGESLRGRLVRGGALPLAEAISILRDIARALAYAHDHGVVHRDIKPDNVMLSGGSAVVTDFGIAKAITAARAGDGNATLTQVGTAIGTPAYMAPEQAAGDPATDHRADLYAYGCVAYEMLTGQPPFVEKSPQQLLAAHMAKAPEPVSARRADVPPALADVVMRCLEKDPEQRPGAASDITRTLEAVTSGGSLTAMPPVLLASRNTLQRALLLYAAAVGGVFVLAKAAIVGIGLPSWVLPGSLVVMALGLPVILLTGYVQRATRRALTHTPTYTPGGTQTLGGGAIQTMAIKAGSKMTWRRTTLGGVAALGAFVVLVGLFMAARSLGIGPAGTLLASGRLENSDQILIAEFTATGSDSVLSGVLAEAMRTSLSRSSKIRIVQASGIAGALRRMERPANTRVDSTLAREIAQRDGLKAIVAGSITSASGVYLISVRLISADSGDVLTSAQESSPDAAGLISAMDRLGRSLRERIGESLRDVQGAPALARVSTPSIEALKKFTEGARYNDVTGEGEKAIRVLKEAIALDSNFAMAYRKLAIALASAGQFDESARVIARGFALGDRVPEAERLALLGVYYDYGPHADRVKGIESNEQLFRRYPEWLTIITPDLLATQYYNRREFAKAESLWKATVAATPDEMSPHYDLVRVQIEQGQLDEAVRSAERARARMESANTVAYAVRAYYAAGQMDSVETILQREASPAGQFGAGARTALRDLRLRAGRIGDAQRALLPAAQADAFNNPMGVRFAVFAEGQLEEARRRADRWMAKRPADLQVHEYALFEAMVEALIGRADRARARIKLYETEVTDTARRRDLENDWEYARAWLAFSEGKYQEAVTLFRASDQLPDGPDGPCAICIDVEVGMAFENGGQPDSAITAYEHFLRTPYSVRGQHDALSRAFVLRKLGKLHHEKNDLVKAAEYYRAFIEQWKDADPTLQPQVTEARARLREVEEKLRRRG